MNRRAWTPGRVGGGLIAVATGLVWHWAGGQTRADPPRPKTIAWWRFEDVPPGQWLKAGLGADRPPFTVTADATGAHPLRTFNTRPQFYPPDTSPDFSDDVATATLNGGATNRQSVRFNGKQLLYTTDAGAGSAGGEMTVEGMFKLDVLPGDHTGKSQTILYKVVAPMTQPTTRLSTELTEGLATRPTTQRTTRPTTARGTTTRATTEPDPVPTELPGDHPPTPIVCVVAGRQDGLTDVNHLAVAVLDRRGVRHVVATRDAVRPHQWYAFAAVVAGDRLELFLSTLDDSGYRTQGTAPVPGGVMGGRGTWTLGCGLIDDLHDDWYQGWIDEVRVSAGAVGTHDFIAAGCRPAPRPPRPGDFSGPPPLPVVKGLADPEVRRFDGIYYLYGTRDQAGYPIYTSTDLTNWGVRRDGLRTPGRHVGRVAILGPVNRRLARELLPILLGLGTAGRQRPPSQPPGLRGPVGIATGAVRGHGRAIPAQW